MNGFKNSELTRDTVFNGALSIWQNRQGYRFGTDSLLLATDIPGVGDEAIAIDLGAGQGAVALTIAMKHPTWNVIAVERQPSLLSLLRRNVEENKLNNVEIIDGDLRDHREILAAHSADVVVCNPPYYRKGNRRPSRQRERAEARHELHGSIGDFISAAAYVLKHRGWLQMITPPLRLMDAMEAAQTTDLCPATMRFYHARSDDEAYLVEYRWRRGGAPDFSIRPPLVIHESKDQYTKEVARRLGRERR